MACPLGDCTSIRSITRRTRAVASTVPWQTGSAHAAEHLGVVVDGGPDHLRGVRVAVAAGEADCRRLVGNELVGGEIVLDALEQRRRQIADLLRLAPDVIALEYRDDLVVGLAAVDDLQPADYADTQQHLGVIDRALAARADIEGLAGPTIAPGGEPPHPLAAVGLRNEAVERGQLR